MKHNKLRSYNLTHNYCIQKIDTILEKNKSYYSRAQIKCVGIRDDDKWCNAICVIRVFPKYSRISIVKNLCYNDIHFLEETIKINELMPFLEQLSTKEMIIDNKGIFIGDHPDFRELNVLPHNNAYHSSPGYLFSTYSQNLCNLPSDLLLTHKQPFFPNVPLAIGHWVDLRNFNTDRDGRLYNILLYLPQCLAYFDKIVYDTKKEVLYMEIKKNEKSFDLFIKGTYLMSAGYVLIDEQLQKSSINIAIPRKSSDTIEELELYLINQHDNILDYHKETRFNIEGVRRVFGAARQKQNKMVDVIAKALKSCENDQTEFKPYIMGYPKLNEIIDSVIAFANTKGGNILIGVNTYAVPIGIEKDIRKVKKYQNKVLSASLQTYAGYLRKEISDKLNKTLSMNISSTNYSGHSLIVIEVPEGSDKPYANIHTNDIYIRKGANNRKPDPISELPLLYSRMNQSIGKQGW